MGIFLVFILFSFLFGEFLVNSLEFRYTNLFGFAFFLRNFFEIVKFQKFSLSDFSLFLFPSLLKFLFSALNAFRRKCRLILQNMFSQFHLKFEKNCATYSMRMIYGKNLVHSSFLQFIFCISNFFLNLSFLLILFDFRIAVYLKNKE